MPERSIHHIYNEKNDLKSFASSVEYGWRDEVKNSFYRAYLDLIYSATDNFFANALSEASRLKSAKSKMDDIYNRINQLM